MLKVKVVFLATIIALSGCEKLDEILAKNRSNDNVEVSLPVTPKSVAPANISPSFAVQNNKQTFQPGEVRALKDLLVVADGVLDTDGFRVEIFDAHCGRGYFSVTGLMVPDRTKTALSKTELETATYTSSGEHSGYDEVDIQMFNTFGKSEKHRIKITSKGEASPDLDKRKKEYWTKEDNTCRSSF